MLGKCLKLRDLFFYYFLDEQYTIRFFSSVQFQYLLLLLLLVLRLLLLFFSLCSFVFLVVRCLFLIFARCCVRFFFLLFNSIQLLLVQLFFSFLPNSNTLIFFLCICRCRSCVLCVVLCVGFRSFRFLFSCYSFRFSQTERCPLNVLTVYM